MNKIVILVVLIAFVFIITYDPVKGKQIFQGYGAPAPVITPTCSEKRYLEVQGLTGECGQRNVEYLGVVMENPATQTPTHFTGYEVDKYAAF